MRATLTSAALPAILAVALCWSLEGRGADGSASPVSAPSSAAERESNLSSPGWSEPEPYALPVIRADVRAGFSNGGWKYDRYGDLKSLDARQRITVADLTGPGMIRHIHTTRHHPAEIFAHGIVLEIWFDEAKEPAVLCPIADFFGDGCNGGGAYFTSKFIECAPSTRRHLSTRSPST